MADSTSIKCRTFADMVSIVENRANIAGDVQDRDRNLIKGMLNEHNLRISTERNWWWRKFDRDIVFSPFIPVTSASVTVGSRAILFDSAAKIAAFDDRDITMAQLIGRYIRVGADNELYKIIGTDKNLTVYLSSPYVGATNSAVSLSVYQFDFALPLDCDTVIQAYCDSSYLGYRNSFTDIEPVNPLEFNRALARGSFVSADPYLWTKEGKISGENIPPLGDMVLGYDLLAAEEYFDADKIRFFPISPPQAKVIHLSYTVQEREMIKNEDEPLMPIPNRWVLVHFALSDFHKKNGSITMAASELKTANDMLKEMRAEHHKADPSPKFIINRSRSRRTHVLNNNTDVLIASRQFG